MHATFLTRNGANVHERQFDPDRRGGERPLVCTLDAESSPPFWTPRGLSRSGGAFTFRRGDARCR